MAYERGERPWETWVAVSNGVDFQHLRTLHGLPAASMPDELEVDAGGIGFRVESPYHLQAGRITGTNTFAQHLRFGGQEMFSSSPARRPSRSLQRLLRRRRAEGPGRAPAGSQNMVDRLNAEDAPVLTPSVSAAAC